jgi:hypothetical protein
METQQLATACGQLAKVNTRQPASIPLDGVMLCLVAEIPDSVDGLSEPLQVFAGRAVFNAVREDLNHLR